MYIIYFIQWTTEESTAPVSTSPRSLYYYSTYYLILFIIYPPSPRFRIVLKMLDSRIILFSMSFTFETRSFGLNSILLTFSSSFCKRSEGYFDGRKRRKSFLRLFIDGSASFLSCICLKSSYSFLGFF